MNGLSLRVLKVSLRHGSYEGHSKSSSYGNIGLLLLALYHRLKETHNCSRVPACPVFGNMSCDTCCLLNLSAIVDGFVETRATIGNKISDKSGHWPKTTYDQMSVMYGEHMPSYYQVEVWSKRFKWGRNLVEDDPKSQRVVDDNGPKMQTNQVNNKCHMTCYQILGKLVLCFSYVLNLFCA